jgi:putative oxidoreductase
MKTRTLQSIITGLLILLFCYTAIAKLMDADEFRRQLNNQEVPEWSKATLVWLIPGSELMVSFLLLIPTTRIIGFYGSAALMTLFTGYMALVVFGYFDRVPCSCGGVLRSMSFPAHFVFNLFFLSLSIAAIYMFHSKPKTVMT